MVDSIVIILHIFNPLFYIKIWRGTGDVIFFILICANGVAGWLSNSYKGIFLLKWDAHVLKQCRTITYIDFYSALVQHSHKPPMEHLNCDWTKTSYLLSWNLFKVNWILLSYARNEEIMTMVKVISKEN